jgi:hypothetical protein
MTTTKRIREDIMKKIKSKDNREVLCTFFLVIGEIIIKNHVL